ncbi:hypothetical protein PQE66_gp028 [Bacillus phage PBC2]|uniref:Uncharacterized protein n=1 Tax=Bacillus phage PBC2 TaxID=1675029 RepID=A0A218KBS0_9CAUD|nr:hypothetical protein PQE66_gp028 [Bacillus phage PBC2]AKQ08343.1 hypothetical protein PBC2_028 [Bacillus phage PBC2]
MNGNLQELLDSYLIGKWKEYDYEMHGARTEIQKYEDNQFVVLFGDANTKVECRPRIFFKCVKNDCGLLITDVLQIPSISKAYDDKVLDVLKGYLIKEGEIC